MLVAKRVIILQQSTADKQKYHSFNFYAHCPHLQLNHSKRLQGTAALTLTNCISQSSTVFRDIAMGLSLQTRQQHESNNPTSENTFKWSCQFNKAHEDLNYRRWWQNANMSQSVHAGLPDFCMMLRNFRVLHYMY